MNGIVDTASPSETHCKETSGSNSSAASSTGDGQWTDGHNDEEDMDTEVIDDSVSHRLVSALAGDFSTQQQASMAPRGKETKRAKEKNCCICSDPALYTCPGCDRRTCSITCVRVHKVDFKCSGERNVAEKVLLSEFTDTQLLRDFRFIEDVRRVVDNCERTLPKMWRYTFRALPPPLHTLREAAKKRGVVCQITSEGMSKRDANTSRYDRKTETITWRCRFDFHNASDVFSVSTDWGSERHRLGDILAYCWSTNPPLPCFHISRQYNKASKWINTAAAESTPVEGHADSQANAEEPETVHAEPHEAQVIKEHDEPVTVDTLPLTDQTNEALLPFLLLDGEKLWRPCLLDAVAPVSRTEETNKSSIAAFLGGGPVALLARAERLGSQRKFFRMSPSGTLNEALRMLFFINEFPVFDVVRVADIPDFPLVTDADKESIRESFRMAPRPPKPERPPRRTKADLNPDEVERYARIPCRLFLAGCCKLPEDACPYWHCTYGEVPACRSFVKFAACEKGDRCSFRHDPAAVSVARRRAREERQHNPHGMPKRSRRE